MPQHEIHHNVEEIFIGRKYPEIDSLMDIASHEGPNHRRILHTDNVPLDIFNATNSLEAAWASWYHLVADRMIREGDNPIKTPDNVRKEAIVAEMMDLMARGEIEIAVFPDSILSQLLTSIQTGRAKLVSPHELPKLKQKYIIKRY